METLKHCNSKSPDELDTHVVRLTVEGERLVGDNVGAHPGVQNFTVRPGFGGHLKGEEEIGPRYNLLLHIDHLKRFINASKFKNMVIPILYISIELLI